MLLEDVTEQIGVDVRLQAVGDAIAAAGHEQLQHLIGDRGYVVVGIDGGVGAVGKRLGQKVLQALGQWTLDLVLDGGGTGEIQVHGVLLWGQDRRVVGSVRPDMTRSMRPRTVSGRVKRVAISHVYV
nr:MAG TPA: hypothetical protein [Caudoviricetes sp.]